MQNLSWETRTHETTFKTLSVYLDEVRVQRRTLAKMEKKLRFPLRSEISWLSGRLVTNQDELFSVMLVGHDDVFQ
jgi:hypothetical protein